MTQNVLARSVQLFFVLFYFHWCVAASTVHSWQRTYIEKLHEKCSFTKLHSLLVSAPFPLEAQGGTTRPDRQGKWFSNGLYDMKLPHDEHMTAFYTPNPMLQSEAMCSNYKVKATCARQHLLIMYFSFFVFFVFNLNLQFESTWVFFFFLQSVRSSI